MESKNTSYHSSKLQLGHQEASKQFARSREKTQITSVQNMVLAPRIDAANSMRYNQIAFIMVQKGDIPMKTLDEIRRLLQDQKPYLYERYGVIEIGVFGSYVRDEQFAGSDIDILIDLGETPSIDLLDLVNLERYLSELLGVKADVAIKSSLRKRIGQRILDEAVSI